MGGKERVYGTYCLGNRQVAIERNDPLGPECIKMKSVELQ